MKFINRKVSSPDSMPTLLSMKSAFATAAAGKDGLSATWRLLLLSATLWIPAAPNLLAHDQALAQAFRPLPSTPGKENRECPTILSAHWLKRRTAIIGWGATM